MRKTLLVMLMALPSFLFAQTRVLGPYLQNAEPTSIKVMWETSAGTASRVAYGVTPSLGDLANGTSQSGFLLSRIHTVSIAGLTPNTVYYYSVNYGNIYSDTFSFKTPPLATAEQGFSMVAFSDMQKDGAQPNKFKEIAEQGVMEYLDEVATGTVPEKLAYILVPGDLVAIGPIYASWKSEFFEPAKQLFSMVPVYPVLGNHEVNTSYFFKYFDLPQNGTDGFLEHWWYKDYSNTRIIGLESNIEYINNNNGRQKQLDWLADVLEDACSNPEIDFVFAQLHHPFESELWPDGNQNYVGGVIEQLEDFTTGCGKPSIHFYGHTHGYSRGQSRDHKHLMVNVASAGGNLDLWGEYGNQTDYEEASISEDEYGFVYLEVEAGNEPKFTLKRISRGSPGNILDNEVHDSIVVYKNDVEPDQPMALSPANVTVNPQCVLLEASTFEHGISTAEHGASQWQVFDDCGDLSEPITDIWKQHENWYFDMDLQAGDDLTDQEGRGLALNADYCWRVRYRDKNLSWSTWSDPAPFSTGSAINLVNNSGAESGTAYWETVAGTLESLAAGECDSRNPYEGTRFFAVGAACNPSSYGEAYQEIDISDYASRVDQGDHPVYFGGHLADYNNTDEPEFWLNFYNNEGDQIGSTNRYGGKHASWVAYDESTTVPSGCRTIRMHISGRRGFLGTANDSYLDALYLIMDSSVASVDTTICAGASLQFYGETFSEPGTYTVTDELSPDCENIYTLNLTVQDTVLIIMDEFICEGDSIEVAGMYYSNNGTYTIDNTGQGGCADMIELNLTVLPPNSELCVTGIYEQSQAISSTMYPNPMIDRAVIDVTGPLNGAFDLHIYDQSGKEVSRMEGIIARQIQIDRNELAAGTYFYHLADQTGQTGSGKFVVTDR